ncbi:peptidase S14 [Cedecea lapagei]|nr:peptidase S14 [Cedecea lapagei]
MHQLKSLATRLHQKTTINPRASLAGIDAATGQNWYEIRARSGGRVEVFIYDEIGGWGITAQRFVADCKEAGVFEASAIDLHIHSPGGDVMQGFAIYNTLARLKATVDIWVDGLAASMASMLICLPGATVHIPANSWVMVHKPWGGIAGDSDDMRDYADWLDRNESLMLGAYMNKTGLDQATLEAMLKAETWLNGAEAVEQGFADVLEPDLQAAACVNENKLKDFTNMPKQINALFAPRAEAKPAPQAPQVPQSPAPQATVTPPPAPETPAVLTGANIGEVLAAFRQEERAASAARVTEVSAVFEAFPAFATLKAECIADASCDGAQASARLLQAMAANTTPCAGPGAVHLYAGNGNIVGDSIRAAVMARAGYAEGEKDNAYAGYSLREMARASLVDRGISIASHSAPMAMVGLAFTHSSSDFGNILMDAAHKAALTGWEGAGENFDKWTRKGTLTDFKTSHRVGLESFPTLREVRPGAEYKYVTLKDRGESIALATYGELFSIDRQTIINDDLSMLTRIPESLGAAARATIGDLVWDVLTANRPMADGKPLFHADHANLISADLSIEGLDRARQAMLLQKSGDRRLNIRPAFMLTPVAIESRANQIIKSASVPGVDANSGISNPIQNFVNVISEARLDDASATDFYLVAAQGRDTIEVAYLDGVDAPYLEQQQGFTVDGAAFKVRIDAGVAPLDHRGLVKVESPAKKK